MYSLLLLFDTESEYRRYCDELAGPASVVRLSWSRATGCAWSLWRAENVCDHALRAVITRDAARAVCQSVRPLSPVLYNRALVSGWLPQPVADVLEETQKSYAASYMKHTRELARGRPSQLVLPGGDHD